MFESYSKSQGKPPDLLMKIALGMTAGACGAVIGTPTEVQFMAKRCKINH